MRPPVDGVTRTKPIRVLLTTEIFDALQKLAGLDSVPVPFKAYQVLKQYVSDNQWILQQHDMFMKNLQQHISHQSVITTTPPRQPIVNNEE